MWSCFRIRKEREEETHFLENGALVLEEVITSFNGRSNPIRSFSKKELERATNNYDHYGVLHRNWTYKLYKGIFEDRVISVKKVTKDASQRDIGECINEVAVASQMSNHKNVLKLLGCCLETEFPTLVYEFPANGCLSHHIFGEEPSPSKNNQILSWESKLRIATEIADAVSYLHNGTSKPIIHRDINYRNILIDQHYVAKLFEFGLSVSIPLGETHVDADVVGSSGFIAPELFTTGRYTKKSDVYNFGVLLFEILTGKISSSSVNSLVDDNEKDMRVYLKANLPKKNIVKGNTEQVMACAELAMRCVKRNPEERPSMMEATKELRTIRRFQQ